MARTPRSTNLYLISCIRGNASTEPKRAHQHSQARQCKHAGEYVLLGYPISPAPVQNNSATAAARGHTTISKFVSSVCSAHSETCPPVIRCLWLSSTDLYGSNLVSDSVSTIRQEHGKRSDIRVHFLPVLVVPCPRRTSSLLTDPSALTLVLTTNQPGFSVAGNSPGKSNPPQRG